MCLILLAIGAHPDYPLLIAANRDEYYQRPTAKAGFWKDHPHILAGRDLECMGTWLGVTRKGRFAALTNFRDGRERKIDAPSRGELVSGMLTSEQEPLAFLEEVAKQAQCYNGFNFLAGDSSSVYFFSSRTGAVQSVSQGIHGLSNHLLDTPWPKVTRGKQRLQAVLEDEPSVEALLDLLQDRETAAENELPDTGIGVAMERVLSPALIVSPQYGTRATTAVLFGRDGGVTFSERTILRGGETGATVSLRFNLSYT
ncbi:MAG: NRDE family protein [Betaproteobacteria bacterium]|nr:MAG: NRDE family protein [Betaproteobacteria bacterium]